MLRGPCLVLPDNVDTDVILPGRYLADLDRLGDHALEGLGPEYPALVRRSPILVAGRNFGAGSSREQAVRALVQAGVKCIIAASFARIFFRNAVNLGVYPLQAELAAATGDEVEVDVSTGEVRNVSTGRRAKAKPLPDNVRAIIEAGGLIPYLQKRLAPGEGSA